MSGKGSKPRPLSISLEQFDKNFDKIFSKKKLDEATLAAINAEEGEDIILHNEERLPIEYISIDETK